MVCGVSHHSLASFFSEAEFRRQVALHRRMIRARFGQTPRVFRNTAGLCDERLARVVHSMGFRVILTEDAGGMPVRNTETLCRPLGNGGLTALTRHGPLSDGMAVEDAEAFAKRLVGGVEGDETIGLMTDCGGFTGSEPGGAAVLRFLETVPALLLERRNWRFLMPSEAAAQCRPCPSIRPFPPGHGGEALLGNSLQRDAANTLYAMEGPVLRTKSRRLLDTWRKLQASDYMEYLCTKGLSEGARGRTPTPFASPYDAYIHTMNILKDFSGRIGGKSGVRP
jgi:alpha-amylase